MPYGWRSDLVRGITWDKHCGRWTARARVDGRIVVVGRFIELTTAVEEKLKAEKKADRSNG